MRPQAVDRGAPADLGAAPAKPAPQRAQVAVGHLARARPAPVRNRRARAGSGRAATKRRSCRDVPPRRATGRGRPSSAPSRRAERIAARLTASSATAARASAPHGLRMKRSPTPAKALEPFRLLVADRERQRVRLDRRPSSSSTRQPSSSRVALQPPLPHQSRIPAGHCIVENLAEIAAEQAPLGKAAAIAAFGLEALGEMVGLTRPGAHPFGADVEQVRGLGRSNKRRRGPSGRCRRSARWQCRAAPAGRRGWSPKSRRR